MINAQKNREHFGGKQRLINHRKRDILSETMDTRIHWIIRKLWSDLLN